jgi:hypothetical protein
MIFLALVLGLGGTAVAQTSTSYKLTEHTLNVGGRPEDGVVASSTSFRITLDSIGDAIIGRNLSSASFRSGGGVGQAFPPPGEVQGLRWTGPTNLEWNTEPSAGRYNVYRDPLASLPGTHGSCLTADLGGTAYTDVENPPAGGGYFYLITVENLLGEEGTRGYQTDGSPRSDATACP